MEKVYFNVNIDCEATQRAIKNKELGVSSVKGLKGLFKKEKLKATFFVLPSDLESSPKLYRGLIDDGHEVGLHLHPVEFGYKDFLGIYGYKEQKEILQKAITVFEKIMGYRPMGFCSGYFSANDFTYGVLEELGFRHGHISCPTRVLPESVSVWAGAPMFIHYANRNNRLLEGDVDFVEIPVTLDWESRMWSGKHPLDLRVELVDAKNHRYTIEKCLKKQIEIKIPVKTISAVTHNIFEYGKPDDFRRQTLEGIINHSQEIIKQHGYKFTPATLQEIAGAYRQNI